MSQPKRCGKRDSYLMSLEIRCIFRLRKYDELVNVARAMSQYDPL